MTAFIGKTISHDKILKELGGRKHGRCLQSPEPDPPPTGALKLLRPDLTRIPIAKHFMPRQP